MTGTVLGAKNIMLRKQRIIYVIDFIWKAIRIFFLNVLEGNYSLKTFYVIAIYES